MNVSKKRYEVQFRINSVNRFLLYILRSAPNYDLSLRNIFQYNYFFQNSKYIKNIKRKYILYLIIVSLH